MSDFMVGNDSPFFLTHNPVFLLFSYKYYFYCFK